MGIFGPSKKEIKINELVKGYKSSERLMYDFSHSIELFFYFFDKAVSDLEELKKMGANPEELSPSSPEWHIKYMKDNLQWHLCDAIVCSKEHAIEEIEGKYKNSKEFQRKEAMEFYDGVKKYQDRFSKDSLELADEAIREVFRAVRLDPPEPFTHNVEDSPAGARPEELILMEFRKIDSMEGHDFEYWCADLLKRVGFSDVEVTQGSGDQGVDVLAVKDGIRYAIQCKCYATDLGNKPVQEVNTGKSIYRCQIGAVMTNRYFTQGAQQAAQATGVLLWDRTKLREMIELSASAL